MRLQINYLLDNQAVEKDDIADLTAGLRRSPKSIPARYFYDRQGSQLFEQISELPEYYPTRTEANILQQYAAEIIEQIKIDELVELGSGSSTKTRLLLNAYHITNKPLYYTPVDVSDSMLEATAEQLLQEYSQLKIQGKVATYDLALEQLSTYSLGRRLIIFLGSSIGNFSPDECDRFIEKVTIALNLGDYFLLGVDLQKPIKILEAAYNDAQQVTAAFNLNILQHLNNRFEGNFNLDLFEHQAIYNTKQNQIEMYLISQEEQAVNLASLNLNLKLNKEEAILTEISRKFDLKQIECYLNQNSLDPIKTFTDSQTWFGLILCQKNRN